MAQSIPSGVLTRIYRKAAPLLCRQATPVLNILIVEDSPIQRMVLALLVTQLGHKVSLAGDGFEAISAIRHSRYDAIFMDCQLPLMSGLQATKYIRALSDLTNDKLSIVGISASASREECLEAGMDDFLPKPASKTAVQEALGRCVVR